MLPTCCALHAQLLRLQPLLHDQLHHARLALLGRQRLTERLAGVRQVTPRRAWDTGDGRVREQIISTSNLVSERIALSDKKKRKGPDLE